MVYSYLVSLETLKIFMLITGDKYFNILLGRYRKNTRWDAIYLFEDKHENFHFKEYFRMFYLLFIIFSFYFSCLLEI